MKKCKLHFKILLFFIPLLLSTWNCSSITDINDLQELLENANLVIYVPKEYKLTPVIKNKQAMYNIAYIIKGGIEVRYTIVPYHKGFNFSEDQASAFFLTFVFNIGKKSDSLNISKIAEKISEFPGAAVKAEFNADFGLYTFCELDPEFGQNYQYCNISMIYKSDCGMVVCYWLFRDKKHIDVWGKDPGAYTKEFNSVQFYRPTPPMVDHPKGVNRIFYGK
jgi:hypothetical protein